MTVFRAFLRVIGQCKAVILLYTVMLVIFAAFQMQTEQSNGSFMAEHPDILIINQDTAEQTDTVEGRKEAEADRGLSEGLVAYLREHCQVADIKGEDAIRDALFYRDISYIITIPEHYSEDFLTASRQTSASTSQALTEPEALAPVMPELEIRSTGDQEASYAEMLVARYLRVARVYGAYAENGEELAERVAETLAKEVSVEIASKLDTDGLSKVTFYYNFMNYSLLAGCVFVICMVLSSFRDEKIRKRTVISSMDYRKFNRILLLSNGLFAGCLWAVYVLLGLILIGDVLLSGQGLLSRHAVLYLANSFVFMLCALTIAFLIGTLVKSKNAVNGIVNVIALGSSFLCGAFVPVEMLPKSVLWAAHMLPSYWYIQTNEAIKTMEQVNLEALRPVLCNMGIVLGFAVVFVAAANGVSRRARKIG